MLWFLLIGFFVGVLATLLVVQVRLWYLARWVRQQDGVLWFSPETYRGVVYVDGRPEFIIGAGGGPGPRPVSEVHLNLWMETSDLRTLIVGKYPYPSALHEMIEAADKERSAKPRKKEVGRLQPPRRGTGRL